MTERLIHVSLYGALTAAFALAALSASQGAGDVPRADGASAIAIAAGGAVTVLLPAGAAGEAAALLAALAAAVVCAITDAQSGYVFDRVTIPGTLAVLACAGLGGNGIAALTGAGCGFSLLFALWIVTKKRGIGLGDAKLAAMLGAAVGPHLIVAVLGGAFVLGALTACCGLLARRLKRHDALRFAPYMSAAFAIATLFAGAPA